MKLCNPTRILPSYQSDYRERNLIQKLRIKLLKYALQIIRRVKERKSTPVVPSFIQKRGMRYKKFLPVDTAILKNS